MDRLSIILTLIVGSLLSGGLVTTVLVLGMYSWPAIAGAAGVGFVLSWPVSYVISRQIKKEDPSWDETRVEDVEGIIPKPNAPEV